MHGAGFYAEQEVELRTATTVTELRRAEHTVVLGDGETIAYDRVLLATGAEPRRLPVAGADLPGVHTLRTLADSDALAAALRDATNVVVIGAGWIGSEVAASARQLGAEVAVVDPAAVPLERVLGAQVGAIYRDLHAAHGVDLHLSTGVTALYGRDRVEAVELSDGARLPADVVVVGVGAVPRVDLATNAGLAVADGVVVDEYLRTSDPDVFAAGDVASAYHPVMGVRLRVEHWANAMHQGTAAGRNMLGIPTPYARIPYFFSDQYELGMEYSGHALDWDQVVFRGNPADGKFVVFWLASRTVVAGMNANVWDVADQIQRLVRERVIVDPGRLADPHVPLDTFS